MVKSEESKIFGFVIYLVIIIVLTAMSLLAGRGLEDRANLDKLSFYGVILAILSFVIIVDKLLLKDYDFTFLHDPEKALVRWKYFKNPVILLFGSVLLFVPFMALAIFTQKSAFVGFTQYQVLEVANLWLAGEPASFTETLIISVLAGIGYFLTARYAKDSFGKGLGIVLSGVLCVLMLWSYHLWRYGGDEIALGSVIFFFTVQVILLFMTGSIIPLAVSHFLNNFLGAMLKYLSNEVALFYVILAYLFVLIVFVSWFLSNKKKIVAG